MLIDTKKILKMCVCFTQDEKTLTKLMSEVQDLQDVLNKHKTESNVRQQKSVFIF